jgi:hypothetical protein
MRYRNVLRRKFAEISVPNRFEKTYNSNITKDLSATMRILRNTEVQAGADILTIFVLLDDPNMKFVLYLSSTYSSLLLHMAVSRFEFITITAQ